MSSVILPVLGIEVKEEIWDSLVRQFSIEDQYEGGFLAPDFLVLTAQSKGNKDQALHDTVDYVKYAMRKDFAFALKKKYRIGTEFSKDADATEIFDKVFLTAEAAAMASLSSSTYSFDTLIYLEVFYWVTLQSLRIDRGEYVDRKHQGSEVRLGQHDDLLDDSFENIFMKE